MEPKDWIIICTNAALVVFAAGMFKATVRQLSIIVDKLNEKAEEHGNRLTALETQAEIEERLEKILQRATRRVYAGDPNATD